MKCLLIDFRTGMIYQLNFLDKASHLKKNYLIISDRFYIFTNIFAESRVPIGRNMEL